MNGLRVNTGKMKVLKGQVPTVRLRIQETILVVFAESVLGAILLCRLRVTDEFVKGVVASLTLAFNSVDEKDVFKINDDDDDDDDNHDCGGSTNVIVT